MLQMHRYDAVFKLKKKTELYIADTLSRDPHPRIMNVNALSHVPNLQVQEIQNATIKEELLSILSDVFLEGWPEHKTDAPLQVQQFSEKLR